MSISLSDDHKSHLRLLVSQEPPIVAEFCKLAVQFYQQGVNSRVFSSAANKLGVTASEVEDAIQATVFLLSHSAQAKASPDQFRDLVSSLGFSPESSDILRDTYVTNEEELRAYLNKMGVQVAEYSNLEWRLDVLVGSRALSHIAEPLVTLKLSLNTPRSQDDSEASGSGDVDSLVLQTDVNNLAHMTSVLEEALHEARTHHSRKIQRQLK